MPRALLILLSVVPAAPAADIDFNRDVRPILAGHCYHCHGPDPATRAAGLRLDTADGALKARKHGAAVVPGQSGSSLAIRRTSSADPAEVMPPPDANRPLTPMQIATLKAWVDQGAKFTPHWAFVPLPAVVPVPAVKTDWVRSPVDAFVLDRLNREKLVPAPEAARAAWLRRVTLDLTGLPPTASEYAAFEADTTPDAYPKVVDRLLGSPRYGERMAADWLDLARFADTHGYQMDRARPVWPYRDWVIQAFNANQPYDQFLTDQIAGDLRPGATKVQRLATAFNRLHMQNEEGGIVEEEFRVAYVADRVATVGTAVLGMTFDCTRCHDHKFDPITQKEYYGLFALFQNIDEAGQTPYFTTNMPVPTLTLSTDAQDAKWETLRQAVRDREAAAESARRGASEVYRWWRRLNPAPALGDPVGKRFAFDGAADGSKPVEAPKSVPGKVGKGVQLSGDNGFTFPGVLPVTRSDPFTVGVWLNPAAADRPPARAVVLHKSKAPVDAGSRGFDLLLEHGRPAFGLYHMWPGDAVKVRAKQAIPAGRWSHVAATHDGSGRAAGMRLYIDGRAVEVEVIRDRLTKDITYGGTEPALALGHRFRDAGFQGAADEVFATPALLTPPEVAALAGNPLPPGEPGWADWFAATHAPAVAAADRELAAARKALAAFAEPLPEIMVMDELAVPKPAFVLTRGAYDAPGAAVTAGTPAALPPFPVGAPRNRLGFARWLTEPSHPLTARVAANRLWQQLFGVGLVETSDNFGTTGTAPTHPELLDWLARDYVSRNWDTKAILKALVLSSTYRQSSRATPESKQRDPSNRLLARAPARRLTAEMLRDQALFLSGLLHEKIGGPSVYPVQPVGLWDEAMGRPAYPTSTGDDLRRRSLYTVAKRTAPHPQLSTFDAPDRSVCVARRQATSTPLQALALLNEPQTVDAARHLGARMLAEGGATPETQVTWLFHTGTGRPPNDAERGVLVALLADQRGLYELDLAAAKLLTGDAPAGAAPVPERAAAAVVALAVLNHAEVVTRR